MNSIKKFLKNIRFRKNHPKSENTISNILNLRIEKNVVLGSEIIILYGVLHNHSSLHYVMVLSLLSSITELSINGMGAFNKQTMF